MRTLSPWDNVFAANGVMLQENDAWYHRRVVELIQQQWPQRPRVDPLGQPGGAPLHPAVLFDYLVAAACPGCGEQARDTALAFAPPVLGSLAVALAWLIGRRLGGERVALVAGLAMGLTPGAFAIVSQLGYADHHVLEVLVSTWVLWELLRLEGMKRWQDGWRLGLALSVFCFTWAGAAMILGMAGLFLLSEVLRRERLAAAPLRLAALMTVAASFSLGGQLWQEYTRLAALGLLALTLAWELPRKLLIAAGVAIGAAGVVYLAGTSEGLAIVQRLFPGGSRALVGELRPLLYFGGTLDWSILWTEYGFTLPFALAGWVLAALQMRDRQWRLVWGWATVFGAFTLMQYRMSAYAMLPLALLAGRTAVSRHFFLAAVILAGLGNIPLVARRLHNNLGPTPEVLHALAWLREDTPPLEKGAYSIQNWWDTGYWISSLAKRIPASNPTQYKARQAARFYTSTDRAEALRLLNESDARYIWFDHRLPMRRAGFNHFQAMVQWAERREEDYFITLIRREPDGDNPLVYFKPAYYQSVLGRVYLHRAKAFTPRDSTTVIVAKDSVITSEKVYTRYEDAVEAVRQTPGAMLLGHDAAVSCVPLEPWPEFEQVYLSPIRIKERDGEVVGAVDIYRVRY
ncbi:MAG: glycosyltransferase family 39 protein [Bryobacterales bacterium]|nr:glycosyltransferase family 39 protein [Bryobacterales bacterium]